MNYLHLTNIDFSALLAEFIFLLLCGVAVIGALVFIGVGLHKWWKIIKKCHAGKNDSPPAVCAFKENK